MITPYVTIIVPFLNASATLDKCIQSIICQNLKDWELILVDDGSTDSSSDICHKYELSDARIQLLKREHQGVAAARNAAIEIAKGVKLCFVDADDTVEPNYLDILCSHPKSDMVVCGYIVDRYNTDGVLTSSESHCPNELTINNKEDRYLLEKAFMSGVMHINCNKLFDMSIIQKYNIRYKHYPVNEDFIFILEYLLSINSLSIVSTPTYHWIRVNGHISGVESIPSNILDIYEHSHTLLSQFISKEHIADRIAYRSYELIIYKYFNQLNTHRIKKEECYTQLQNIHNSNLVKNAFRAYSPSNHFERIIYTLNSKGYFRVSYAMQRFISFIK